ncbi:hypothetical protein MBH78_18570 [Oceanimonas sp. NS1]|nr:hypothetical protein [Oceanimonas sp. NS1]
MEPGHVSVLALVNDSQQQVELWLDETLRDGDDFTAIRCAIPPPCCWSRTDLLRFTEKTGHVPRLAGGAFPGLIPAGRPCPPAFPRFILPVLGARAAWVYTGRFGARCSCSFILVLRAQWHKKE